MMTPGRQPHVGPAPEQIAITATVARVLHDGNNGAPWCALVEERTGHQFCVFSEVPLVAPAGSDIHAQGYYTPSGIPGIPDSVILNNGLEAQNRLSGILQGGTWD
jgi:hypothetical protein